MRAVVVSRPGGPEALELTRRPVPAPREGEVLIRVRAFGLNRAELFTRHGDDGAKVPFPRIIGIECVGEVVAAPGGDLEPGQRVAALMGGMGRRFDGSYAEYTRVPRVSVFPLETALDWATLGALPEMFQTCNGSLKTGLRVEPGQTLLIRGGSSSIGLTSAALARQRGLRVLATTRSPNKVAALEAAGVHHVILDHGGSLVDEVRRHAPAGAERVLELVGTTTLRDSLRCAAPGGLVCMTGILGGAWIWDGFQPLVDIPNGVALTSYGGGSEDVTVAELQGFVDAVARGDAPSNLDRTFTLDELPEAHRFMEANRAKGKLVVVV
ncbi:MAG: zinc-binding dehydrogenase [Myxococcales bacterium]|nr:zinc-binding dehydrogenase [Myxococcales bacterium]